MALMSLKARIITLIFKFSHKSVVYDDINEFFEYLNLKRVKEQLFSETEKKHHKSYGENFRNRALLIDLHTLNVSTNQIPNI